MSSHWTDKLFYGFMGCLAALMIGTVVFVVARPPPTPTQHYLITVQEAACCVAEQQGYGRVDLQCGKLIIHNATNYLDSGKPCE